MPEAAMDEYHLPMPWKHNVGIAGKSLIVQPIAAPHAVQFAAHDHLGLSVCLSDALHPFRQAEFLSVRHDNNLSQRNLLVYTRDGPLFLLPQTNPHRFPCPYTPRIPPHGDVLETVLNNFGAKN